jgi:hypothetical protein
LIIGCFPPEIMTGSVEPLMDFSSLATAADGTGPAIAETGFTARTETFVEEQVPL